MRDLTEGPIDGHLFAMAAPIAAGMIFQTLYFLVDLYFVGRLGGAAIAGVGSAGNLTFLIMALTQVLGVGTVALIAQAVGRKDQARATLIFNQSSVRWARTPRRAKRGPLTCADTCRDCRCNLRWWRWPRRCEAPASSSRR